MKKFYTVKEASKILGVSTNTVYKYVDTGSLVTRRLGRGRIKIPFSSLSLIADLGPAQNDSIQTANSLQPKIPVKSTVNPSENGTVSFGVNDIIFFRAFRGLTLLGLGIIHFANNNGKIWFTDIVGGSTITFLTWVCPFLLIIAGLVSIFYDFRQKSPTTLRLLVHVFNTIIFSFYTTVCFINGNFGEIVFIVPLGILAVTHIVRGIRPQKRSNFYDEFLTYITLLAFFGMALISLYPNYFPVPSLVNIVGQNQAVFASAWLLLFVVPMIYFLSPYGKYSKLMPLFFAMWVAITLVIATQNTILGEWNTAYMGFLVAAYGIFFALWMILKVEIEMARVSVFLWLFFWIGTSLLFGLGAIRSSQNQLLKSTRKESQSLLLKVKQQVNGIFSTQRQTLVEYSGKEETRQAVTGNDRQKSTSLSKQIYERLPYAGRVLVYTADGIGVGTYPINTLVMGTDYSSRDYFLVAKSTYGSYTTSVFQSILGNPNVIQVEPVFQNNKFAGLLGVSINLSDFSERFNPGVSSDSNFYLVDENSTVVYSNDKKLYGKKFDEKSFLEKSGINKSLFEEVYIDVPRWKSYHSVPYSKVFSKITNLNINLTVLFVFNVLVSLGFGFAVASDKKADK